MSDGLSFSNAGLKLIVFMRLPAHGSPVTIKKRVDSIMKLIILNIFPFVTSFYVNSYSHFFTEAHTKKAGKLLILPAFSIFL